MLYSGVSEALSASFGAKLLAGEDQEVGDRGMRSFLGDWNSIFPPPHKKIVKNTLRWVDIYQVYTIGNNLNKGVDYAKN